MSARKPILSRDEIADAFGPALAAEFPPILSPDRFAALLGRSPKTVRDWMAKGRLDGAYRKRGKHALIWRDKALDLLFNGADWT